MLELYQAEDCPHCRKVRAKRASLAVSYIIHNPRTARGEDRTNATHQQLIAIGGKDQVPFFIDTNREHMVYESEEIMAYLEEHYGPLPVQH